MKSSELEKVKPQLLQLEDVFRAANPGVKVQGLSTPKVAKGFGGGSRR